ncbi:TIGR03571 family LLM class oxidoreductase [Xanthomonas campestris]|uniref:TIGR03571 family LLM class oxidoreductase n=1 Tax=Xanthomonas campestris TaxID=339 RepID=UPI002358FF5C|nr:TIGR03571 family LLM class oxidoreductase [Xanthomonas campestris]MDC8746760.1 TIGR03571 family LLM class oxidoreductase [Xanthomonas campestris]
MSAHLQAAPASGAHDPSLQITQRVFPSQGMSVGLILPLESHPGRPAPTMRDHLEMARRADALGFATLWLRDVPFYDPRYGDVAQVFEPMVYMAHLAAVTHSIGLGTAGIVLPIREPKILAKQATSIDQLSGGRLLLGLSSGDRPSDYPLFGIPYEDRGERFREAFEVYRAVSDEDFPVFDSAHFGRSSGALDLIPKPWCSSLPKVAIGRAQQTEQWIAEHMDALLVPAPPEAALFSFVEGWNQTVTQTLGYPARKPLGIAGFLDLSADPRQPFERVQGGFRAGRESLISFLRTAKEAGVAHVALNPKISQRPYADVMQELADYLMPALSA